MAKKMSNFKKLKQGLLKIIRSQLLKKVISYLLKLGAVRGIKARIIVWSLTQLYDYLGEPLLEKALDKLNLKVEKSKRKLEIKKVE